MNFDRFFDPRFSKQSQDEISRCFFNRDKWSKIMESTLCMIRDIYRAIAQYEAEFERIHGVGLTLALLLCTLQRETLSSGEIACRMGLSRSNASKILRSSEARELIRRKLDERDRRRMYFTLTPAGQSLLKEVMERPILLPDLFQKLGVR